MDAVPGQTPTGSQSSAQWRPRSSSADLTLYLQSRAILSQRPASRIVPSVSTWKLNAGPSPGVPAAPAAPRNLCHAKSVPVPSTPCKYMCSLPTRPPQRPPVADARSRSHRYAASLLVHQPMDPPMDESPHHPVHNGPHGFSRFSGTAREKRKGRTALSLSPPSPAPETRRAVFSPPPRNLEQLDSSSTMGGDRGDPR